MATFRMPPNWTPKVPAPVPEVDFVSGAGDGVNLTATGLGAFESLLRTMPKNVRDAAGFEMQAIGRDVIAYARENNFIPYDTGALYDSGDSDDYDPNTNATITKIAMWFGGPPRTLSAEAAGVGNTVEHLRALGLKLVGQDVLQTKDASIYAMEQHENMQYDHHGIGGPKYLERPFLAFYPAIQGRIAAAAGIAIGFTMGGGWTRPREAFTLE